MRSSAGRRWLTLDLAEGCTLGLAGAVTCVSKLTAHFCTLAALHPFVDTALQNFPEIHIFTSAKGINSYQWALIQCSASMKTRAVTPNFTFQTDSKAMSDVKWLHHSPTGWSDGGFTPGCFRCCLLDNSLTEKVCCCVWTGCKMQE